MSLPLWAIVGMVVVAAGATALLFTVARKRTTPPGAAVRLPATAAGSAAALTPTPYQYDRVNNRYWDPNHMHWHSGPPPDSAQQAAGRATTASTSVTPTLSAPTRDTTRR